MSTANDEAKQPVCATPNQPLAPPDIQSIRMPGSTTEKQPETSNAGEPWTLRLYVAGQTPKSLAAFANLKAMCEEHLSGRYQIEVIDLLEKPQLAQGDQILAIPTVVRRLPLPMRKIIGDLSDTERAIVGLDLRQTSWSMGA